MNIWVKSLDLVIMTYRATPSDNNWVHPKYSDWHGKQHAL